MNIIKLLGAPGSITFLVLGSALGLLLIYAWPPLRRVGRLWLLALYVSYLVLGIPWIANAIANALPGRVAPTDPEPRSQIDTLIVFDGDNRRGRVLAALEVLRTTSPRDVMVLSYADPWIADALVENGVDRGRIKMDDSRWNTREQMDRVRAILKRDPNTRIAIVASRLQMPRVIALADAQHFSFVPVASPIDDEPSSGGLRRFVPSYFALRVSRDALYEHVALTYYAWRGWIALR